MGIKKNSAHLQEIAKTPLIPEGLYSLPTSIILYQKQTGLLWANPHFEKEFGATSNNRFQAKKSVHLLQERPVTLDLFSMVGRHEGFVVDVTQNGVEKKVPVGLKVNHYGDASDECYWVMVEDLSIKVELENKLIQNHLELQKTYEELKHTQAALIQSAKLASLGELSSGIAHELNQPLQAIMGCSQELECTEHFSEQGKEFIGLVISASRKMAEIIRSLRSFAREAGEKVEPTSIRDAASEAIKLMHHQMMQKGIEVDLKDDPTIPVIIENSIQLQQVFVNLLSNARDAIEEAGNKKGKISVELSQNQSEIFVKVRDNGCGMNEKTKEHVFDPFFTTKEVGKGTGLGMSISYGILKKMKAEIDIKTREGEGTEFTITIPRPSHKGAVS